MNYRNILKAVIIIVTFGACLWFSFNYLIWFLPPQPETHDIALADLDGDGDLDAFLANGRNEAPEPNAVLLNDGRGNFRDSGQKLGNFESRAVALGDVDGNGTVDVVAGKLDSAKVWFNDGTGRMK